MTKQTKSQTPKLEPTQDFKCAWWGSKFMSEMMLEKDCATFLNFFPKPNPLPSSKIVQKGEHKLVLQGEILFVAFQMGLKQKWTYTISSYSFP